MSTDIATVRAKLLVERQAVVDQIAAIDLVDETARFDAAEAALTAAQNAFDVKARRWNLVQEKLNRLPELDRQITLITP